MGGRGVDMSQLGSVLFVGNAGAGSTFGAFHNAFFKAVAAQGFSVSTFVPGSGAAPVGLAGGPPADRFDVVHLTGLKQVHQIPELRGTFVDARFFLSIDGVRDGREIPDAHAGFDAVHGIFVPHPSIVRAFRRDGQRPIAKALRAFEQGGRLFVAGPSIDTAAHNPSTDRYLGSNRFSSRPVIETLGQWPNPSGKIPERRDINRKVGDALGFEMGKFTDMLLFGPDISRPLNMRYARTAVEPLLGQGNLRIVFTGEFIDAPPEMERWIRDTTYRCGRSDKVRVGYVPLFTPEFFRVLGGTDMALFPAEPDSPHFPDAQYAQIAMLAMRYGAVTMLDRSFMEYGFAGHFDGKKRGGNAVIFDSRKEPFADSAASAVGLASGFAFVTRVGNFRYSTIVPDAMDSDFSSKETAKALVEAYRGTLNRLSPS